MTSWRTSRLASPDRVLSFCWDFVFNLLGFSNADKHLYNFTLIKIKSEMDSSDNKRSVNWERKCYSYIQML